MCTLWFVFSIVLTLGFIFFRLTLGRVGFSTILFIGTVIICFKNHSKAIPFNLFCLIHWKRVVWTEWMVDGEQTYSYITYSVLVLDCAVLNVPWKFSFIKSIQFPRRPSEMCNSRKAAHYLNLFERLLLWLKLFRYWFSYLPRPIRPFEQRVLTKINVKLLSHY